jgi:vacuolar-type H+-ATPase subunit I/STV1
LLLPLLTVLLDSALIPLCVDTQQEAAVFLVCKRQQGLQELTEEVEKENTAICEQMKGKDQVILTSIANHQQEDEISQEKQQLPVECQHKEESKENPEAQLTEYVRALYSVHHCFQIS